MLFSTVRVLRFSIDDKMRLTPAEIYKHFHGFISYDLIRTTLVLLGLISVRDGAFCLHQLGDNLVRSLREGICRFVVSRSVCSLFFLYYLYDCTINIIY